MNNFEELRKTIPDSGDILYSFDEPVGVHVEIHPNEERPLILYVHARIDKDVTGWYLYNRSDGLKVLIDPCCYSYLKKKSRGDMQNMFVDSVRVLRKSAKETSIIAGECDV